MARKRAVFLSGIQSFLAIYRKSWLIKHVLIFTFAWSLTLLPSLLPNFGLAISRFKTPAIAQSSVAHPPADSGSTLSQQAQQLYEQGDLETAVSKLKQAIEKFGVNGDTLQQAQAWSNLSLVHQARADWRQAEIAIANSIRLAQLSSTQMSSWLSVQAQALETQAKLNFSVGQFEVAMPAWDQATRYYTQAKNELGAVRSQLGHNLTLQEMGLHREALKQLLKLSENRPAVLTTDPSLQATCLRSLGNAVRIVGFVEIQEAGQSKTLTVSELGQHCGVTLSDSAGTKVDYLDQATDLLQKAIALAPSSRTCAEIALLLGHTAQDKLRRLQDAYERQPTIFPNYLLAHVETISQAYEQAAQSSDALIQAQAKVKKLSVLVDFDRWLQRQETQLQQRRSSEFFDGENVLKAIAGLRQGLKQSLINQQTQLPDLIDKLDRLSPSHIAFYTRLHLAHRLLPVPNSQTRIELITIPQEQMLALLQNTLAQAKELGDRRSEAFAQGYLGQFAESQSQWFSAKGYTQSAVAIAEEIVAPDIAYQWHWQLGRLLKQQDQIPLAIKEYEMAIANLDQVRNNQISLKNADIQFSFRDQVEPVYRQLIELLLQSEPLSQSTQDQRWADDADKLQRTRQLLEQLQIAELENYLRCPLPQLRSTSIDKLVNQSQVRTAVFYPVILPDRIELILQLPQPFGLKHYAPVPVVKEKVEQQVRDLIKLIQDERTPREEPDLAFQQLYGWLLRPLEQDLEQAQIEHLVFVPDSSLQLMPLVALYDSAGQQYVVEKKYSVSIGLGLQAFANQPLQIEQAQALVVGVSDFSQSKGFRNLPYITEQEIPAIRTVLTHRSELINEDFTPENLRQQVLSQKFKVVHLATHGQFSSSIDETFLLAYGDRRITLNQLNQLLQNQTETQAQPIDLLVLSACQTATGDRRARLGIAGATVRVGAVSTVASLESVNDASTAKLMGAFYEQLKQPEMTKASALRNAQQQIIKEYPTPLYWSLFVLLGNWQ